MNPVQDLMKKAVALAPDAWIPGGKPDPLIREKHGAVGAPISRLDGPLKVQGRSRFAAEFPMERLTYAALAYSTIAKGRITALDTRAAEAAPGVVLVMSHKNAPKMAKMPLFGSNARAAGGVDLAIMQDDLVHWNGQPIAVVLAETQEQADHAMSLIEATYAEETAVTDFQVAKLSAAGPAKFQGEPLAGKVGDAEAALAAAAHKVDATYTTPFQNHNAMELHGLTLAWEGETLRVHDATQAVAHEAWTLAQVFGLKDGQVRVTSPYVGGGFGGKTIWDHQVIAAAAARMAGRPVRCALSREGVYRVVGGRTTTEQRVALGAGTDGRLEALIHTGITAKTPHNAMPEPVIVATTCLYSSASFKLQVDTTDMDMLANTFMRAPGEAVGTFALESAVDELAHEMGMDPVELRIRNEPEKDPLNGLEFSSRHLIKAWRDGAKRFGWGERSAAPGGRREGEWSIGLGCAAGTYPYYRMPGGAARLTLKRDGSLLVEIAAHDMGMGTATAHTQVVADRLGLSVEQVTFHHGDSNFPGLVLAGGSQQTASIGASVIAAHRVLVGELLKLAGNDSPLAGLKPDEIGGRDGGLCKLDEPDRFESYGSILSRAQRDAVMVEGQAPPPLELGHWSMHSYGALFCEARVNALTGETRISRFLGSYDCGTILNPKTATSQFRGGIIMGLGAALMEETMLDARNGRIMNPSFAEYHMPSHADVPEIEVIWTGIPDPHAPMGAHGIGEIGITGVAAAVANAIFNATGKRVRDLPITLDKLM